MYTYTHRYTYIHMFVSIHTQYVLKKGLDLRKIKLYAKAKAIILCSFQVKSQSQYFSFTPRTHFVKLLKKTFQENKSISNDIQVILGGQFFGKSQAQP